MKRHVIIGNGGAAISAVLAIRSVSSEDEIVIISKEACPAYSPVLTTYYLSKSIPYEGMFLCDDRFYRRNAVQAILGKKAIRVVPTSRAVLLEDGTAVAYDDLLIATGSSPVVPPIAGVKGPGVFTLWTVEEARAIWEAAEGTETVAIIGAGLIGIQALSAMAKRGKKIIIVEMMDQIMPQALDQTGAGIVEERLRREGVDLRLGQTVQHIDDLGRRKALTLSSGEHAEADMVILAVGIKPNTDLLEGSGVKVHRGVLVDESSRTNIQGIYAAGDVAESVDTSGESAVNATWPNAIEQGRFAGLNMAGRKARRLRRARTNISTVFGLPFASVDRVKGDPALHETLIHHKESYLKLIFQVDLLVGVVLVGEVDSIGILASFIERRRPLTSGEKEEVIKSGAFPLHARTFFHKAPPWSASH